MSTLTRPVHDRLRLAASVATDIAVALEDLPRRLRALAETLREIPRDVDQIELEVRRGLASRVQVPSVVLELSGEVGPKDEAAIRSAWTLANSAAASALAAAQEIIRWSESGAIPPDALDEPLERLALALADPEVALLIAARDAPPRAEASDHLGRSLELGPRVVDVLGGREVPE